MALAIMMQDLDNAMTPFKSKMQKIATINEKKKKHSDATKKGLAPWLLYRSIWLKRLEEFPDIYPSYNEKIKHIAGMWRICKASIASRRMERLKQQ
tara:strand:+ start:1207 stop:1494 length:288 start_codon:yes stop_codon:yes gene_type:complete